MKKYFILTFVCLSPFFYACDKKETKSESSPDKIVIGMLVAENGEQNFEKMEVLSRYFTKKLSTEVQMLQITNASAMIEAMRAKKIHVGSGGAFTYLVASAKANAEAIVTTAEMDGKPQLYHSCLITHPNSGLKDTTDLFKRHKELTLTWAYPTSTSGHLIPRYFLQQHGIKPEDFKEVYTSTDHAATVLSVASGKTDVAAIMVKTLELLIKTGKVKKEDVRIIWVSEPIVEGPLFVRKDMDSTLKNKIQNAFVVMEQEDPAARAALRTQYTMNIKYIPISDAYYQPLRNIVNQIEGLKFEVEK